MFIENSLHVPCSEIKPIVYWLSTLAVYRCSINYISLTPTNINLLTTKIGHNKISHLKNREIVFPIIILIYEKIGKFSYHLDCVIEHNWSKKEDEDFILRFWFCYCYYRMVNLKKSTKIYLFLGVSIVQLRFVTVGYYRTSNVRKLSFVLNDEILLIVKVIYFASLADWSNVCVGKTV